MNTYFPEHGIQRLIADRRGDRSMESLSKACGGIPTRANLQRMATTEVKTFPTNEVILGLAKGLQVRAMDVVLAFCASLGLPLPDSHTDLILPGAGNLPEASQRIIRETADNMLWWQEQAVISKSNPEAVGEVHNLFPADRIAASKGEPGVDPEQLPE